MSAPIGLDVNVVPYPWQVETWHRLTTDPTNLPHALLLTGVTGLGKMALALKLAQLLLCHAPRQAADGPIPCAACSACRLFAANTQPDLFVIRPERRILLPDIHHLRQFLQLTSHLGGVKVAVLERAETMNMAAANALLKILEEPPPRKFIVLVTANLSLIPATVRSRCVAVPLLAPSVNSLMEWFQNQAGAVTPDPFLIQYGRSAPLNVYDLLASGRGEILRRINRHADLLEKRESSWRKLAAECQAAATNKKINIQPTDIIDLFIWRLEDLVLTHSSTSPDSALLHRLHRALLARRRLMLSGINLSQALLYAECALLWQQTFTKRSVRARAR